MIGIGMMKIFIEKNFEQTTKKKKDSRCQCVAADINEPENQASSENPRTNVAARWDMEISTRRFKNHCQCGVILITNLISSYRFHLSHWLSAGRRDAICDMVPRKVMSMWSGCKFEEVLQGSNSDALVPDPVPGMCQRVGRVTLG